MLKVAERVPACYDECVVPFKSVLLPTYVW